MSYLSSQPVGRWASGPDEGHASRLTIGELARAAAAPGWSRLVVRRAQVGADAFTVVTCDDRPIDVDGLDEPFQRLREMSYKAGIGTWFTCELVFPAGSRGYTARMDSSAQPFAEIPAPAALAELTMFPREEPPAWLLAALPTAVPIGLPATDHDPWHRQPGKPRPAPSNRELSYIPAPTMTARSVRLRERIGRSVIALSERPGDTEPGDLKLVCREESYRVIRAGVPATGGLRSLTLDGSALRLELTAEAADALGTETVFDVHLELPPDAIADLRAALPRILSQTANPPALIGV